MSGVPRWLKVVAGAAAVMLLVALAKPSVAGLLLRAFAVGIVGAMAVVGVVRSMHDVVPADGIGRRVDPTPPADLPRELHAMGEVLRTTRRRDPLPYGVLRPLRAALQHRLWHHHGLSTALPDDDAAIRRRISPTAYALLQAASPDDAAPVIPGSELPALIQEVESL